MREVVLAGNWNKKLYFLFYFILFQVMFFFFFLFNEDSLVLV